MNTYNETTVEALVAEMTTEDLAADLAVYNNENNVNVDVNDDDFLNWICQGIAANLEADGYVHEDCA